MLSKPRQAANTSTLPEVKKGSSVVISTGSNNHMQRSRASKSRMVVSLLHARPADVER